MDNNIDNLDDELGTILKEIIEIFAKYEVDYLTGMGVSAVMLRAGMLGCGIEPDEADKLLKEISNIYRETYEVSKDTFNSLDCGDQDKCDACEGCGQNNVEADLWKKIDLNLN